MLKPEVDALIVEAAVESGIEANMLRAFCMAESGGDPFAVRYEVTYPYIMQPERFALANGITTITEQTLQKMSYGLMQIMGANCRAQGFTGSLLQIGSDPRLSLKYAVKHLNTLYFRYGIKDEPKGWEESVVAAYNAGSARRDQNTGAWLNEAYVKRVAGFYSPS